LQLKLTFTYYLVFYIEITHDTNHTLLRLEVFDMRRTQQIETSYISIHEDVQYFSQN